MGRAFPDLREGGNAAFPAFRAAGERGTPRSLLSDAREKREDDVPASSGAAKGGNAAFPALPADGEWGTSRSLVSAGGERREDRLPSFAEDAKAGNAPFPPLLSPGKPGRSRSPLFVAREEREDGAPSSPEREKTSPALSKLLRDLQECREATGRSQGAPDRRRRRCRAWRMNGRSSSGWV